MVKMNSTSFLADDSSVSLQVTPDLDSGLLSSPELLIRPRNHIKKNVEGKTPTNFSQRSSFGDSDLLVNLKTLMEEQLQEIMSSAEGLWSLHEKGEALNVKTDGIHQEVLVFRDTLRKRKGKVSERMNQVTNLISPSKRPKPDKEERK